MGNHRLALLKDGAQTYRAMLDAIGRARSTICLESYILNDDVTGRTFAEALIERSRAGVEVNLIYDAFGSKVSSEFLAKLHEGGVRTVCFHPVKFERSLGKFIAKIYRRDHRKMLVVDGDVGFTGGVNLSDDYAAFDSDEPGWRDTHLRLEGPAARELQYRFLRTWRRHRGAKLDASRYPHAARRPDGRVRVVGNGLWGDRRAIREAYLDAIRGARERIRITSAYFLPTVRVLRELRHAGRRGVDVQVMVAGTTDVPAVRFASRAMYGPFLHAGVRIFEWKGRVLHAKTAAIDGRWATVGSSNLDSLSLRVNMEINAVVEDRRFASAVERMFEEDLASCEEIRVADWEARPLWEKALGWVALLFRRWL